MLVMSHYQLVHQVLRADVVLNVIVSLKWNGKTVLAAKNLMHNM